MSEQHYDIFFKGEALDGHDVEAVKGKVGQLFKAPPEKVAQLFSGKVVALKKNLDKPTALKFKKALEAAGAKIYIKAAATEAAQAPSPAPAPPPAPAVEETVEAAPPPAPEVTEEVIAAAPPPAAEEVVAAPPPADNEPGTQSPDLSADELDMLPAGSDVLTEDERHEFIEADIDLSHIHLASVFAQQMQEDDSPPPPAPDVSHISTAEVGADMLEDNYKPAPPPPAPDTDYMSMAEVGEDLETLAKELENIPEPDISGISIAEAGADIDPTEKAAPPPAPDVSHIQIAE